MPVSRMDLPDNWIEVRRGERCPQLFEQVLLQKNGFALVMLHLVPESEDEAEEHDLERSWEVTFRNKRR